MQQKRRRRRSGPLSAVQALLELFCQRGIKFLQPLQDPTDLVPLTCPQISNAQFVPGPRKIRLQPRSLTIRVDCTVKPIRVPVGLRQEEERCERSSADGAASIP